MVWPIVIGAAIGAAKHYADSEEARRQRKLSAAMARNSPWSSMEMAPPKNPNLVGNVSSGALAGAQMQQQMGSSPDTQTAAPGETNSFGVMQDNQNPGATQYDPYTSPWGGGQQPAQQQPNSYGVMQNEQPYSPWGYMRPGGR